MEALAVEIFRGSRVELQGLSSYSSNGLRGKVLKAIAEGQDGGRIPVKLTTSGRQVKVKRENLKVLRSSDEFTTGHGFCLDCNEDLRCRRHTAEVCSSCNTDHSVLNAIRRQRLDPDDARFQHQVVRVIKGCFRPRSQVPVTTISDASTSAPTDISVLLTEARSSGTLPPAKATAMLARLFFEGRDRPDLINHIDRFISLVERALLGFREVDLVRWTLIDILADEADDKKRIAAEKKSRKGKSTDPLMSQRNSAVHVHRILRLLLQHGVDMEHIGPFMSKHETHTANLAEGQSKLQNWGADCEDPNESIPLTEAMRDSLEKCAASMEWQLQHSSAPMNDPVEWKAGKVMEFLIENEVLKCAPPHLAGDVAIEVARELRAFKLKIMYNLENMPDDDQAVRIGRGEDPSEVMGKDPSREARGVEAELTLPSDLDPRALPVWQLSSTGKLQDAVRSAAERSKSALPLQLQLAEYLDRDLCSGGNERVVYKVTDNADPGEEEASVVFKVKTVRALPSVHSARDGQAAAASASAQVPILCVQYYFMQKKNMLSPEKIDEYSHILRELHGHDGGFACEERRLATSLSEVLHVERAFRHSRKQFAAGIEASEMDAGNIKGAWRYGVFDITAPLVQACPSCGKPATKICSRCKAVGYCSSECEVPPNNPTPDITTSDNRARVLAARRSKSSLEETQEKLLSCTC